MKDNLLPGDHLNKVAAVVETTKFSSSSASVTSTSSGSTAAAANRLVSSPSLNKCSDNAASSVTNFDDDYNEWCDIGIGDLIIDLDADIEKNNVKNSVNIVHTNGSAGRHQTGVYFRMNGDTAFRYCNWLMLLYMCVLFQETLDKVARPVTYQSRPVIPNLFHEIPPFRF